MASFNSNFSFDSVRHHLLDKSAVHLRRNSLHSNADSTCNIYSLSMEKDWEGVEWNRIEQENVLNIKRDIII